MNLTTLADLILEQLAGLYDAEQQLVEALPLLAEKAFSEDLRDAITAHFKQTKEHVKRIEDAFRLLKTAPRRRRCRAMEGLVGDAQALLWTDDFADPGGLDASLICATRFVEHFEIAAYGSICSHARLLEANDVAKLLEQTLDEERETDRALTDLAESLVNPDAAETDEEIPREASGEDEGANGDSDDVENEIQAATSRPASARRQ